MAEENERQPRVIEDEGQLDETEFSTRPGWHEIFRRAFDKARREQQPASRRELGRDRSRSLFLLAGAAIAVLLLFLGVFSSSNTKNGMTTRPPGTPDLGRRVTAGQQRNGQTGSVTPLLNAQTTQAEAASDKGVTAEEVGRTARPAQLVPSSAPAARIRETDAGPYALGRINFSDTPPRQDAPTPTVSPMASSDDLRKPSLVFVRSAKDNSTSLSSGAAAEVVEESPMALNLPAGTRLMARLQALVSTAVKTPAVAAIEYNYERDGEIAVPAGAQVLGNLQQADRSGYVAIHFDTIQMPDGTTEKIDATAMSLRFGPLKGVVSGKRTGTNFLIRAFTGIGQAASYMVGSNGVNAPLSQGALLRGQIATNIGIAGDQQLNSLAFNQNIVVSVPGNTRFYVVIEKDATASLQETRTTSRPAGSRPVPTAEELRELMQLRQELSELYQQPGAENAVQHLPEQQRDSE